MGAIHDDCHTIDGETCLSCFRCIRICPEKAKHINVEPYLSFAREFSLKLRMRRENEYFYCDAGGHARPELQEGLFSPAESRPSGEDGSAMMQE